VSSNQLILAEFTAVINSVFCLDASVINKHETLSVVTFECTEIMGTNNTPDIIMRDTKT